MADLVELIGDIYASVLEPELWGQTLEATSDVLGAGVLMGRTNRGAACDGLITCRTPPDAIQAFSQAFGLARPVDFIRALPKQPLGEPLTPEGFQGEAGFLTSPVYREVFEPCGLRHLASAVLHRETAWFTYMTLHRPMGAPPFSEADLRSFRLLAGHFGRAVAMRFALASAKATGALLSEIVDRFDRGAFVVDAGGGVRLTNRLARAILERGDGLMVQDGRLRTASPQETADLLRLVAAAAVTSAGDGEDAGGPVPISRPGSARSYVAIVSPLGASMLSGSPDRALALVLVGDPERSIPPPEHLAAAHGFTQAEARLATRLMFDETPAEAAAALGISITTVRFHLRNMLAKTGTRRQAELVAMLHEAHWR